MADELRPKHRAFALRYIADPKRNGKQAAIEAGYSPKTAEQQASRLLRNVKVKAFIDEEVKKQEAVIRKDGEYIVRRMLEAECIDLQLVYDDNFQLKPMKDWPAGYSTLMEGLSISLEPQLDLFKRGTDGKPSVIQNIDLKIPSRRAMWELLGRHFGLFKDKLELSGNLDLAQRLARARQRTKR